MGSRNLTMEPPPLPPESTSADSLSQEPEPGLGSRHSTVVDRHLSHQAKHIPSLQNFFVPKAYSIQNMQALKKNLWNKWTSDSSAINHN